MNCECCKKRKAEFKNFRTNPETNITGSYFVCKECFNLKFSNFFKIIKGKENAK